MVAGRRREGGRAHARRERHGVLSRRFGAGGRLLGVVGGDRPVEAEAEAEAEGQGFGQVQGLSAGGRLVDLRTAAEPVGDHQGARSRLPHGGQEHLRATRRGTPAAPDDAGVRGELEEAAYALCVVMGQRSAHGALLAAEQMIAVNRLEPRMLPVDG
ncbi:DUF5133 domain-containing protein [Streptomyces sp. NRRL F-2580]|uniref:DUF5133 domain-containing protein n=1 Tax=Streptomyces sp. NRRL F-2580 TaxID=1463841 RepID=UPI000D141C3F|nr:DUF5133 domain-containing protein [Streptomyces sp. NRRL F-2580]